MKCFHGTSLAKAIEIINGSTEKDTGLWNCCDRDGAFYVYPQNKIISSQCLDEDEDDLQEQVLSWGINDALWHAQSATCKELAKDETYVILEMDIPDELLQDDHSANNMESQASFITEDDMERITFEACHVGQLNVYLRPFVLASIIENVNFSDFGVDESLLSMAQLLAANNVWLNTDEEANLSIFPINDFKEIYINA
ncbi:hypothetical protein Arno18_23 [Pectobacterium phage Arno18]|uniref:Uncharacterized protein n=1 Tax=Pectobacterium phage Arno18 TaxID=2500578 RepID=A0A678ZMT2_9CAUD|nr:hypothetical protein Arno18_23 [Pectobacterium phage Arno18]